MRVLVTGGLGFVGINLVRSLAAAGDEVLCADRASPDVAALAYLAPYAARITHLRADLLAHGALAAAVATVSGPLDAIVHAAALTATTLAVERDAASALVGTNIGGTMEALELAAAQQFRRFVYVSSPSAIGPIPNALALIDETVEPAPVALYGITKLTSERLCRRYGALTGLSTVSVRIAQPYGPLERRTAARVRTSPIHEWLSAAFAGRTIHCGELSVGRDWTYIDDTVRGIALLLCAPQLRYDLYHLGAGRLFTVGDILAELCRTFPELSVATATDPADERLNPNIAPGALRGAFQIARLQDELGFTPQYDLTSGLARYLTWLADFAPQTGL